VVLFPGDEVLVQRADLSVVEEREVEDEGGGEHAVQPQLRSRPAPLTPRKQIHGDFDTHAIPLTRE